MQDTLQNTWMLDGPFKLLILQAETTKKHLIKYVLAGTDGSFLLTTTGRVLACGSNQFNKLGFYSETSGLKKHKKQVRYEH